MLPAARNGHAVQHLEKIKVQRLEQRFGRAPLCGQLAPCVEGLLCAAEDLVDGMRGVQLVVDLRSIALIGQCQLIAQVVKAVVDRRGREHQHPRAHPCANDLVEQPQIAVLALVYAAHFAAISEIVGFIDDYQIIVTPIQARQIDPARHSGFAGEVCMIEHVIAQAVLRYRVVDVISLIRRPVFRQLLGAQYQHGSVAVFIVLDDRKRREGLSQSHAVRQYAAVVLFQLIDDGQRRVLLKTIEHVPYLGLLEARQIVGQDVFGSLLQKRLEYVVQREEVDKFWGVLLVDRRDAFHNAVCHILQLLRVVPYFLKEIQELAPVFKSLCAVHKVKNVVATLTTKVNGRKAVNGHIGGFVHVDEALYLLVRNVRAKMHLAAYPLRTLLSDSLLRQFVAQLNLKFGAVKAPLPGQTRNVKFPLLF